MTVTDRADLADRLRAWVTDHQGEGCAVEAISAVLDLADRMAVGIDGPNIVGQAFGTQLRDTIAAKVLTAGLAESED